MVIPKAKKSAVGAALNFTKWIKYEHKTKDTDQA
jgi:hypothetical protein